MNKELEAAITEVVAKHLKSIVERAVAGGHTEISVNHLQAELAAIEGQKAVSELL